MKINGETLTKPKAVPLVFPREDGDIVFKITPCLDFERYEKLCPTPKPPEMVKPNGTKIQDFQDERYLKAIEKNSRAKIDFLFLESLKETEGLEWDTIKENDPTTWGNLEQELKDNYFIPKEIDLLLEKIMDVNGLNPTIFEEARNRFLAGEEESKQL